MISNVIGIGQLILNLFAALGDFLLFNSTLFVQLEGWQYGFQTLWGYLDLSIKSGTIVYALVSTPIGLASAFLKGIGLTNAPIGVCIIVVAFFVTIAIALVKGIISAILSE